MFFLPTKSLKNHPQKLLRRTQIHFFPYCPKLPKRPKQKNSCSKLWLIHQLYIELGYQVDEMINKLLLLLSYRIFLSSNLTLKYLDSSHFRVRVRPQNHRLGRFFNGSSKQRCKVVNGAIKPINHSGSYIGYQKFISASSRKICTKLYGF